MTNPYETDKLLHEYLLFHYGTDTEVLPHAGGPRVALGYPVRCVTECLDLTRLPRDARALDLGCAVGRSTFELARHCREVIGIDYSHNFIRAAAQLQKTGSHPYRRVDEGDLSTPLVAQVPTDIERGRVHFEQGDARHLRPDLGSFDVVLGANLVDRLPDPARFLQSLGKLVKPGGQLILTSPYTWLEEYTARDKWLGGYEKEGKSLRTGETLRGILSSDFEVVRVMDLPFLIREHARKYQWSVAEASLLRRKG